MSSKYTQPFYGPFSGTTRASRCQQKSSYGLYGTREDNRARHTDHLAERHTIRTNQRPTSIAPDTLPAATFSLYPGLGQAPNMLACIPSGVVNNNG